MSGRNTSSQAAHYRQLAYWTSDERTHDILLQMARELDEEDEDEPPEACKPDPRELTRFMS